MKMLSIRDPWATLIARGVKDVENRSWRTNHRGPVLIHASRGYDQHAHHDPVAADAFLNDDRVRKLSRTRDMKPGHVLAVAELVDAHQNRPYTKCGGGHLCSPWGQSGTWHFTLTNVRRLTDPFPWVGHLGIRDTTIVRIGDSIAIPAYGCTCGTAGQYGMHEPNCGYEQISTLEPAQ